MEARFSHIPTKPKVICMLFLFWICLLIGRRQLRANLSGNFALFARRVTKSIAFNAETQQNYLISGRDIWRKAGLAARRGSKELSLRTFSKGSVACLSQIQIPRCYSFPFLPKGILNSRISTWNFASWKSHCGLMVWLGWNNLFMFYWKGQG